MRNRRSAFAALIAIIVVVLPGSPVAAADPWLEVKSPNFTVLSNGTEARARNVAWQFEQIRTAIQSGWPWSRNPLDRPLLIVAARNEATMRTLAPRYWEPGQLPVASVYGLERSPALHRASGRHRSE